MESGQWNGIRFEQRGKGQLTSFVSKARKRIDGVLWRNFGSKLHSTFYPLKLLILDRENENLRAITRVGIVKLDNLQTVLTYISLSYVLLKTCNTINTAERLTEFPSRNYKLTIKFLLVKLVK